MRKTEGCQAMTNSRGTSQMSNHDHFHHHNRRCGQSGSWNPHLRGSNCVGLHQIPQQRVTLQNEIDHCHNCGCHLNGQVFANSNPTANGIHKASNDVRYRSFHNFNHLQSVPNAFASKSRASWAVPFPHASPSKHYGTHTSSGFMSYPSEVDFASHPDLAGCILTSGNFRRVPTASSCNCLMSMHYQHGATAPMFDPHPHGHFLQHTCIPSAASAYDLSAVEKSQSFWMAQSSGRRSHRKNQACQTSEEVEKNKSLRWTKEQLKKFDNLILRETKSAMPNRNGSLSSSSGGGLTDDSGVHSRSTSNSKGRDKDNEVIDSKPKNIIGRVSIARRPIRKLPSPPKRTAQAQVVKLNTSHEDARKHRSLPPWPPQNIEPPPKEHSVTERLSNFFRNVKLTKSKREPGVHIKIFGTDLLELHNTTSERVPSVLVACTEFIEKSALVDGVYRISGIASNIKKLKSIFESSSKSTNVLSEDWIHQDIHCVPSLVKLFFRELPEPLCSRETLPLLKKAATVGSMNSDSRESLPYFRAALSLMKKPHYWTLKHLLLHLQRVSTKMSETGMSSKNLAIVWTPNLLRTPLFLTRPSQSQPGSEDCKPPLELELSEASKMEHPRLQFNLVQNTQIVQYLIENAQTIFQNESNSSTYIHAENCKSFECDVHATVAPQNPLSKRYVTSLPIEDCHNEVRSLPVVTTVTQSPRGNIVRLSTRNTQLDDVITSQPGQIHRLSTIINVSGYTRPTTEAGLDGVHHDHPTHHPNTHRHIHPVIVMRTVSQV